jgi:hypothetical protein
LILFLAIVAYDLNVLESPNFWDYLVDPLYWLFGIIVVIKTAVAKAVRLPANSCAPLSHK